MTFSIFNLQKTIVDANKKLTKNKKINQNENFGFKSLSSDAFKILINANQQFIHAPKIFCGLSGKNQDQFKMDLVDAIRQLDPKKFKELAGLYRKDIKKQENQKWYDQQQKNLSPLIFWNGLLTKVGKELRSRISQIKNKWQTQKEYAHYNSLALKYVAEKILPIFEQYVELAHLELHHNGNRLPKKISKSFSKYLVQLQNDIDYEKQKICWAMLGRLEVASKKGNLSAEDVTVEVVDALKEVGVIQADAQFPEARSNLTSECFEFFHSYAIAHGKKSLKNRIKHLTWFRENANFITLEPLNQMLLVPKVLASFVPEKPSRFSLLLSGVRFRYQFLRDQLALMSRLRLLDKHSLVMNSLLEADNHPSLKAINDLEKTLFGEYHKSANFKPSIIQHLFQRQTCDFMRGWHHFLQAQLRVVLDKKLQFLSRVTDQIKTRLDFELDTELLNSNSFKQFTKSLIDNIECVIKKLSIDASMLPEYQSSKELISRVLNHDIRRQSNTIHDISEQQAFKVCSDLSQNQKINLPQNNDINNELNKAKQFLEDIKVDILFLENNPDFTFKLEEYSKLVKQYQDKKLKSLFNRVMHACFTVILEEYIGWKEEECNQNLPRFKGVENVLLTIAPKSIRTRMSSLCDLASKDQWFLWQLKCQSYLKGLDVDFNSKKDISASSESSDSLKQKTPSFKSSVRFFNQQLNHDQLTSIKTFNHFIASNDQVRFP